MLRLAEVPIFGGLLLKCGRPTFRALLQVALASEHRHLLQFGEPDGRLPDVVAAGVWGIY